MRHAAAAVCSLPRGAGASSLDDVEKMRPAVQDRLIEVLDELERASSAAVRLVSGHDVAVIRQHGRRQVLGSAVLSVKRPSPQSMTAHCSFNRRSPRSNRSHTAADR
jgi:hypothetical protein